MSLYSHGLLLAAIGLLSTSTHAATLAVELFADFGNSAAGTQNFNVSVNGSNSGYSGTGASGSFAGTIEDYAFYQQDGTTTGTIATYAVGTGSSRIGTASLSNASPATAGNESFLKLWETNDPGANLSSPSSSANFTTNTMLKNNGVSVIIDIAGMSEGMLYLFYGQYRTTQSSFNITLSDMDSLLDDVDLTNVGLTDNTVGNNNETSILAVSFDNTGNEYETLTFNYLNSDANRGRLGGVVLTAVPEPSAFALIGIGGLILLRRRR